MPNQITQSFGSHDQHQIIAPLGMGAMVRVVWHGKWLVAAVTATALFLGGYYAFKMTSPQYAATATLQIDAQPAHLGDVSRQWPVPATDAASLNTEVSVLTSDRILQHVVAREALLSDPEFNRYLRPVSPYSVNALRGRLRNFIAGTTDPSPDAAAVTIKTVQNLRNALSAARPRDTFLFQITARSTDADKAARLANSAAVAYISAQIETENNARNGAINWLGGRVTDLRQALIMQENEITNLIAGAQIQDQSGLDVLSNAVLLVDQERATAHDMLAAYEGANPTARQSAEIAQLQNEITLIEARSTRLRGQLSAQSTGLIRLQQMQREADTTRVLYQSFRARLQETQVQRGLAHPNSTLIAPAVTGQYVGPRKTLILLISAMVGVLLGLAAVGFTYLRRDGVMHPSQLQQHTYHPVLATLGNRSLQSRRQILQDTRQANTSSIHKILAGLMIQCEGKLPAAVIVTATKQGEGKSALAFSLACKLSQRNKSVLIVQADRDSKTAKRLWQNSGASHSDAPFAPTAIEHDAAAGCDVLKLNTLDALLEDGFQDDFKSVSETYAHIIINAPPMSAGPEATLLAKHAGAIVYAVKWSATPMQSVLNGLAALDQNGSLPTGIVISQTKPKKMRHFGQVFATTTARQANT